MVGKDVIGVAMGAGKSQNPQIDDNGNGIGNEKTDGDVARDINIGKGFVIAGDIPSISTISQDQVLNGQTSATITVEVVTTGRITRVWAIVHSPDFTNPTDNPITDLPTFDLTWNEQSRRYEGTYDGFTVTGTYTVTVYAMNENMIISLPKTTTVEQTLGEASIGLQSPSDGASFGACSLSSPPTFSWTSGRVSRGTRFSFPWIRVLARFSESERDRRLRLALSSGTWKKILMIPGSFGGTIYWRVVGRRGRWDNGHERDSFAWDRGSRGGRESNDLTDE